MTGDKPAQLVVIGASAGGIEALARVLSGLPSNFPAPIVIAQHINPGRPSLLAEVLGRSSSLPVRTIAGREPLTSGTVFVVPSNRHVGITDHEVSLYEADLPGPMPSVDRLLSSAAAAFGERLVAVILSGTGSDGTAGAQVVKRHGGTVVIENPETAKFPGMPQSLAPSTVDIIAGVEKIGPILHDLMTGAYNAPETERFLDRFLDQVRARSGIDFSSYKRPTIRRRLHRRMAATNTRTLDEYWTHLENHPEECQRLVASFLIKVTEFFRDPDLFAHLHEHILPDVISRARAQGNEIRIWSAGCATGEEAYSLAIGLCEVLGAELDQFQVRLFATDVDPDAVAFARRGVYPVSALSHVDKDLVARYFTEEQGEYAINAPARSLIIFGQHDLGQRPPFPNIDLVLCRNVLIYFTTELQQRALQLFSFSLRDGGYLVLGKAEIASPLAEFLRLEHSALKIYRRHGGSLLIPPARIDEMRPVPLLREIIRRRMPDERDMGQRSLQTRPPRTAVDRLNEILLHVPVGIVVVNANYDVQHINNSARQMLGIRGPAVGEDVVHASPSAPPGLLKGIIDRTFRERVATGAEDVAIEDSSSGRLRYVDLACYPSPPTGDHAPDLAALVMLDTTAHVERHRQLEATLAGERLEWEKLGQRAERVAESNRDLEAANQALATLNMDLRTANAEFLVSNEEVQAAGEEVETLNEELQATNEELETLNEELQATVEELHTSNEDLQARSVELQEMVASRDRQRHEIAQAKDRLEVVLASMGSALLVVDAQGRPVIANEAYERRFGAASAGFQAEDLDGHPLPPDSLPQQRAARGEAFSMEFVVVDQDGSRHWFDAVGNPLRGEPADGGQPFSGGGVVVMRDVSDRTLRRLQDEFLAMASHELRTPLTAVSLYAGMLRRTLDAGAPADKLRQIADDLAVETRRMGLLVNDLMDVGRLQSGRVSLDRQDLDLVQVLRHAADLAQHLARGQVIHLHVPELEVRVNADPNRLEQVIMNLLENAITYAAGTVRIDLRLRVAGQQAEVEVQDYGPGIPAAELPHVFSRYYRVARPGRHEDSGLGLGLYIVHRLVDAHGGRIDVSSVEGEGTVFIIHLPLGG